MVTAESLTRKLRDRNGNPKELVSLANDLLHEKVTVYLPHKETVLMEWILDKLNQSNGTWKTNFETWKLLEYLWCTVDRETADREFSDHHLISLLAATLDTFHGQERVTPQLLEAFISFLNTLINSRGNYRASVDSEISLISSYLAFMSHSIPNYSASLAQCLEPMLTQLVNHITIRRQLSTLLSRSIDSILILLGDYQSRLPLTLETFIDSLLEASFRSDEKIDFISFLVPFKHKKETELSSHIDPSRSAMHYFQTWLKCPNRRDVAIREFPRIVQLWPTSVIGILETLVELHEVPSDDSLKEILASNKSNWKLIRLILLLNPTLILSECQGLFTALISSNEKSKSEALLLMLQLINTYSQARDFDAFFHLWKAQLDIPDSLWSQDLIVREITNHLSKLSLHLIDLLLKEILDFLGSSSGTTMLNSEYLPLFAIITSLQRFSSQSIYSELQTTLYKLFNCNYANINSDFRIWNLRYEVLSLSPSFVTLFKDSLLSQLNLEVQSNQIQSWASAFSVVLRCREFYNLVEFDSMVKRILEVVPQHPIGLTVISDRWLVLVESLFNNENKDILVTLYFQNPTKLEELFSNDIFYEQRTFSRRIINRMQSVLSTKTHSNKEMQHAILKCIAQSPIEIFPKLARLEILDGILANLFKDIESYKDTNMALLAATNIIQWPTYSSKVENDPHIIQKLFKSFDLILARKLLSRIIEHHTVNLNNISSRKYINDLSTTIADKLNKKFSDKRIDKERPPQEEMWILEIASVMAQNSHVDIKFRENTVKGILYFLSTSTTYDERTVRLIKDLSDLMVREVASQSLREDITKVVGNLTVVNLNSDIPNLPLLENLFVVLCITTIQSSLNALPLIALALQLISQIPQFTSVLEVQSTSDFESYLASLSRICFDVKLTSIQSFYLLESFVKALSKEKHESARHLVVSILSQTLMKSSELSKESLYALAVVSDILLKEKSWIVSQYMLELILAFVTRVASCKINDGGDLYIQLTRVCSSILLFHRHRINGRYHLVLRAFINLSSCLTSESPWLFNNEQSLSLAYARLVSNLCEPPIQSIREKGGKSNLTSSSALAKQTLGKFLPILLVNYINASLNQGFTSQVSETLKPALYNIFEVLGTEGVKTTSSLVDSSARAFLKIIYDNYMTNGKWQG